MSNTPLNNHADLLQQIRENKIKLKKVEPVHHQEQVELQAPIKQDNGLDIQDDFDDKEFLARQKANIEKVAAAERLATEKLAAEKLAAEKLAAEQQAAKKAALEFEQAAKEKNNNQIVLGKEKSYQDEVSQILARRAGVNGDKKIKTQKPKESIVGMSKEAFKEKQNTLSEFLKNKQSKEPAVVLPPKKDDNLKATQAILTEVLEKRIKNSAKQVPLQQDVPGQLPEQQDKVDEVPGFVIPDAPPFDLDLSVPQAPKQPEVTPSVVKAAAVESVVKADELPPVVKAAELEPIVAAPQVQAQKNEPEKPAIVVEPNRQEVQQEAPTVVMPKAAEKAVTHNSSASHVAKMKELYDNGIHHPYKYYSPTEQDHLLAAQEQVKELIKDARVSTPHRETFFELASDIQARGFDDLKKARRTPPRGRIIEPEAEMVKEKNRFAQENSDYLLALQLQQQEVACLCVMTITLQQSYLVTQQTLALCAIQAVVLQTVVEQVFVQASYSYVQQSMFYQNAKNAERDLVSETENSNPFRPMGRCR